MHTFLNTFVRMPFSVAFAFLCCIVESLHCYVTQKNVIVIFQRNATLLFFFSLQITNAYFIVNHKCICTSQCTFLG